MLDLVEKYSTFDDQQDKAGTEGKGSVHRDEVVVRIRPTYSAWSSSKKRRFTKNH